MGHLRTESELLRRVSGWVFGVEPGLFGRGEHARCGACGHILKGLTEPRCPECGESI